MSVLYPTPSYVEKCKADLEQLKSEILGVCLVGNPQNDISVARYNMARDKVKDKYDSQVVFMLDSSGYVNQIISAQEKQWLKHRNSRK